MSKARLKKRQEFYDLTVPLFHNYWLAGTWHHNSGKSACSAYKVAKFVLNTPPPRPFCPFWVISRTTDMSAGTCWNTHLRRFISEQYVSEIKWLRKSTGWPKAVVLNKHKNGNEWVLEFKSLDGEQERLMGASIGGFWQDEFCPHELLVEIFGRCRDYFFPGSMIYSLTPIKCNPQMLRRIYENPADWPQWKFYRMNLELNDRVSQEYKDQLLANEMEELRATRTTGAFANFSGQVYKQFDPNIHVVDPFDIPANWYRCRTIDLGFSPSHPQAVLFIAKDDGGRYFVYHEIYASGLPVEQHLDEINKVAWKDDVYHGPTYVDSANPGLANEYAVRSNGFTATPVPKTDVKVGIAKVQRLLREGRLFVFRSCRNTIAEFGNYSYHPTLDQPKKESDHALDALRYFCMMECQDYPLDVKPLATPERKVYLA